MMEKERIKMEKERIKSDFYFANENERRCKP